MILDNMDDDRFVDARQDTSQPQYEFTIRKYLPQKKGGSILIIFRDRNATFRFIDEANYIFKIQAMTVKEVNAVLNKRLNDYLESDEERSSLAAAFEYISLALTQVVAYINR